MSGTVYQSKCRNVPEEYSATCKPQTASPNSSSDVTKKSKIRRYTKRYNFQIRHVTHCYSTNAKIIRRKCALLNPVHTGYWLQSQTEKQTQETVGQTNGTKRITLLQFPSIRSFVPDRSCDEKW